MAQSVYIASAEGNTGKSTIAVGILESLVRTAGRVGVFRPISRSTTEDDYVLDLLHAHATASAPIEEMVGATYDEVHADPDAALSQILGRFKAVERRCDAVVIVGSDYTDVGTPTELRFNARIAANLGAPVLLVLGGRKADNSAGRTADEMRQIAEITLAEFRSEHADLLGVIVNRCDPGAVAEIVAAIRWVLVDQPDAPVSAIPEHPQLVAPTLEAVYEASGATRIAGDPALVSREVEAIVVAAMTLENVLPRLVEGAVVIIPGDRSDVLLGVLVAHGSETFPSLAGIILNGGFDLPTSVERLIAGVDVSVPVARNALGTYETVLAIRSARGRLAADSDRKYAIAISLFEQHVDTTRLLDRLSVQRTATVTPLMFEYGLLDRARNDQRRIVLPEGDDDRVLRAAGAVLQRGVADIIVLGDEQAVRSRATGLGVDLSAATIVDPAAEPLRTRFAEEYVRLRAHKGVPFDTAHDTVSDVSYFGTMMVQLGYADGMVSGAKHTTAHTIRPAFEVIKTAEGVSVVSSVFLMALADRVLVYGDCAVIPDPTAEQLADIAVSAATTARLFGIDPRVAMLSYSTGESGSGADVDKVRQATALVRERAPELLVEGPIQYDAAADPQVAAAKMPGSPVAGCATVFVFPDLNTGNNTYKAVQRSSGALAIGPVLQGLRKPINDLSRGALVQDIVNTIAITAIQAQAFPRGAEEVR